jgi:tripartite-type tricarboxylate transporter receptor subunit TctC
MQLYRGIVHLVGAALAALAIQSPGWAQVYPERAVRVIVPYAPGGPTDIVARLVSQKLSDEFGKQFYVENIPGGGGNIGMGRAAQAAPDGYTVVFVAPPFVVNPALYEKVPFDPGKDFDPVTLAVNSAIVLTVHPSLPATNVKELVALVRTSAGKYSYASPGIGTPPHLLGELFRLRLELDVVHVPFNSGGLAIGSALAGHTPISFGAAAPAAPHIADGKLRALAVTNTSRSQALPQVPTMAEAGYPEIVGDTWFGVVVPAGTPREIVGWLNDAVAKALRLPDVLERVRKLGFEPVGNSPAEFAAQLKSDGAKWAKVIRDAGIRPR